MAYLWDKSYETGNALIDSQHQELVKAINELMTACGSGRGRDKIESTVKYVANYTEKHFSDEEKLQIKYKYPDYPNHKQLHEGFKRTVAEIGAQLVKDGPTIALVGKVNANIGGWLINHIKREDTKVASCIAAASK
ncbi:hemerythrin [Clostridia bacterium]|nr:hemerythrin [Clostridia bacterium]